MNHPTPALPTATQVLNGLTARITAGTAKPADFGMASLMLRVLPLSRKERRSAGANLGTLRLLWTIAQRG